MSTYVEFQIGSDLRVCLETDATLVAHETIDDRLRNTAALDDGLLRLAAGTHTQTVTLAGDKATATIDSSSNSSDTTTDYYEVYQRAFNESRDTRRILEITATQQVRQTDERSHYESSHTVDDEGHAHGGKFTATSHSQDWSGRIDTYERFDFSEAAENHDLTEETTETTIQGGSVTTDVDESGWYADWVFPFFGAIRVQGGKSTQVVTNANIFVHEENKDTRWGEEWHAGDPEHKTDQRLERETGTTTRTTKTSYGPFGSSETTELSQDHQDHSHRNIETDYPDSDVQYYDRTRHDLETHISPTSTSGHGSDQVDKLDPPDPGVEYHSLTEYDPFDGVTLPDAPKNPPAKVSAVTRGEPGGSGTNSKPQNPPNATIFDHSSLTLSVSSTITDGAFQSAYSPRVYLFDRPDEHLLDSPPVKVEEWGGRSLTNFEGTASKTLEMLAADPDTDPETLMSAGVGVLLGRFVDHFTQSTPSHIQTNADGSKRHILDGGPTSGTVWGTGMATLGVANGVRAAAGSLAASQTAEAVAAAEAEATAEATGLGFANPDALDVNPIQPGELTTYQDFVDRSVVGDQLEAHELWQHANIKAQGLADTRLSTPASQNNPVMALEQTIHRNVNTAQRAINAASQTPFENIGANAEILRSLGVAPEDTIFRFQQMAIAHAISLGF